MGKLKFKSVKQVYNLKPGELNSVLETDGLNIKIKCGTDACIAARILRVLASRIDQARNEH